MYCLLVFALVASVSGSVYNSTKCPVVKPVQNFKLHDFGQGTWYEVARYPNYAESAGECGSMEYALDGDLIKVKHIHIENNKNVWIEGIAELDKNARGMGKLIYSLPYGDGGKEHKYMLDIIHTNYKDYAIAYFCKYDHNSGGRQDFAWILSRSKILPIHVKAIVEKYVKESDVLEYSKFMWPDFSEGACRIEH